jgi:hypothetical protein
MARLIPDPKQYSTMTHTALSNRQIEAAHTTWKQKNVEARADHCLARRSHRYRYLDTPNQQETTRRRNDEKQWIANDP